MPKRASFSSSARYSQLSGRPRFSRASQRPPQYRRNGSSDCAGSQFAASFNDRICVDAISINDQAACTNRGIHNLATLFWIFNAIISSVNVNLSATIHIGVFSIPVHL